ncbi:MAG: short-chain fatty acyl-CoA regulator family protein [Pseudomonadota bacterium]
MHGNPLVGSRIRERRQDLGLKQVDLARSVDISASYLNLIEHNRRRIGGKLLLELARSLGVDPAQLIHGAELALADALREAARGAELDKAELDRLDQLVRRFPGWARLIATQAQKLSALERTVDGLSHRLTHDPFLAETLHTVLSTVTAIRSTSSILSQTPDIDAAWRRRFHANLYEDSTRLADTSQALVSYFDRLSQEETRFSSPQDSVEDAFAAARFDPRILEKDDSVETMLQALKLDDPAARSLAERWVRRFSLDARLLPTQRLMTAIEEHEGDPDRILAVLGCDADLLLRRLAFVGRDRAGRPMGLFIADGSGAMVFRKPIDGFAAPRFGAGCPLWPLFQALGRVGQPIRQVLEMPGGRAFEARSVAKSAPTAGFSGTVVIEAAMLVAEVEAPAGVPVGTACRICPRSGCVARREIALVGQGF